MPARHVVVDGSNIATEGNSLPSLKQLDEAVREYLRENPDDTVTVVVDATFGHRIPAEEREMFEQAEREGDIVSPPAGAIGRGDAFLLRIADKVGAVVLSNDSFQEFHGEHEWLFDKGRLIGGKPVPGVGWIFTPRSPVRGPKSRESVKEAKRKRQAEQGEDGTISGLELAAGRSQGRSGTRKLQKAIEAATEEAVLPEKAAKRRRRRRRAAEAPAEPVNDPLAFINFIASYRPGEAVEGVVEEFSSHGAYISAGGARCYLPLSAMGNPPPRSAREVLRKGEARTFTVQAFDPMRRGVELALPGFARPAGAPTAETVEAEIHRAEELAGAASQASAEGTVPAGAEGSKRAKRSSRARLSGSLEASPEPEVTGAGPSARAGAEAEGTVAGTKTRPEQAKLPQAEASQPPSPDGTQEAPKVRRAKQVSPPRAAAKVGAPKKAGAGATQVTSPARAGRRERAAQLSDQPVAPTDQPATVQPPSASYLAAQPAPKAKRQASTAATTRGGSPGVRSARNKVADEVAGPPDHGKPTAAPSAELAEPPVQEALPPARRSGRPAKLKEPASREPAGTARRKAVAAASAPAPEATEATNAAQSPRKVTPTTKEPATGPAPRLTGQSPGRRGKTAEAAAASEGPPQPHEAPRRGRGAKEGKSVATVEKKLTEPAAPEAPAPRARAQAKTTKPKLTVLAGALAESGAQRGRRARTSTGDALPTAPASP